MLSLIRPGTSVRIADGLVGTMSAVSIRPARDGFYICYEVDWWDGRDHKSEWFHESQVSPSFIKNDAVQIGFATSKPVQP